jgi:hypothetical protein
MHLAVMGLPLGIWEITGSVLGTWFSSVRRSGNFTSSFLIALFTNPAIRGSTYTLSDWGCHYKNHRQINQQNLSRSPCHVVTFQDLFDHSWPWAFTVRAVGATPLPSDYIEVVVPLHTQLAASKDRCNWCSVLTRAFYIRCFLVRLNCLQLESLDSKLISLTNWLTPYISVQWAEFSPVDFDFSVL